MLRCHRLQKQCTPSISMRKRGIRRPTGSRTARLEEKLNDLVLLLKTQQEAGDDLGREISDESEQVGIQANAYPSTLATPGLTNDKGNTDFSARATSPSVLFPLTEEPSPLEAEECLKRFREEGVVSLTVRVVSLRDLDDFIMCSLRSPEQMLIRSAAVPPIAGRSPGHDGPTASRDKTFPVAEYHEHNVAVAKKTHDPRRPCKTHPHPTSRCRPGEEHGPTVGTASLSGLVSPALLPCHSWPPV